VGVELKPLLASDIEAWAGLLAACEKVDNTGEHYDADDLLEEYQDPARDQDHDFVAAWVGDRMVGSAAVRARDQAEETHKVYLEGWTHPDHRGEGIGTILLAWGLDRAGILHEATFPDVPGEVECRCLADDSAAGEMLVEAAFEAVRWFFTMEADLADLPDPLALPDGLTSLPYADVDSERVRQAHNTAFGDHWGFVPWSPEMWKQWVDDARAARPEYSRVLVTADGEIAAYVSMQEFEAETAVTGIRTAYVAKVGVLPAWRRRGIASALLSQVLHDCRAAGYPHAALDVDADNPTGALGVYERLGFRTTTRWVAHTRAL
jgi:mycothiol synthase